MNKPYILSEVRPQIFLLSFDNYYDMAMQFCRYQEFYESSSVKFRGKSFEIFDFMKWYSNKYGKGSFTYPKDWAGFNIPGDIVLQVNNLGISDFNKYDQEMQDIYNKCIVKYDKFYLIGAVGSRAALKHEIAHGFFYTTPQYKKDMTKLVKNLDPDIQKSMKSILRRMGYATKVLIDECQAYLSTGLPREFDELDAVSLRSMKKPFQKLFNSYYNI